MYFDNDYVRVLTIHSHTQLLSLLADHAPSKHILLHLSCSNCSTCNSLDNDFASLSLQYPADCLFLRCNVSKLTDTAQWAAVDTSDQGSKQPIVRVLPSGVGAGGQQQAKMDVVAAHSSLALASDGGVESERIVNEIKDILVNKLQAVHFNDWSGDTSSDLIQSRISTHHLLHDHDHDHDHDLDESSNSESPIPFDQMPPAMSTLLASPIHASATHPPDSGRGSSEALSPDHGDGHAHDHAHDLDGACCASSDEDGDPYEADDDEDICPCCRDRLAAESVPGSSSRSSMSRSRTRSRSSTASSAARMVRPTRSHAGRQSDQSDDEELSNDIDDVVAIGDSGSIPTSPLVGRIRRQLPGASPAAYSPEADDGADPLAAYVDRLEAIKRGDALQAEPTKASGALAAVGRFVLDNAVSLMSFLLLVVALALTVRIEIVPADAKLGR